jgi:predicted outer membrane repeat protein
MKRTWVTLAVLLCLLPVTASANVLTEADAAVAALDLAADVGAYTRAHPDAAGAFPAWTSAGFPAVPILVYSYPALEPAYYMVVIQSEPATVVTLDPFDGDWHGYGEVPDGDPFPRVSRARAATLFAEELRRPCSEKSVRAVEMPDRRLYWHVKPHTKGSNIELLLPLDEEGPVRTSADITPAGDVVEDSTDPDGTRDSGDPDRWGSRNPNFPKGRDGTYPPSYDIPDVPHHFQQTNIFCGPASLEMLFDYWGPDIEQFDVAAVADTRPEIGGTGTADLVRAARFSVISTAVQNPDLHGYNERRYGYAAVVNSWDAPDDFPNRYDDLKILVSSDEPVMLLMWFTEAYQFRHYRVVKGYDDGLDVFIVHDPWYSPPYWGPDFHFNQEFFVDDMWDCGRQRWGMFTAPLDVIVSVSPEVAPAEEFTVVASVIHTCPDPFEGTRPLANAEATISLASGLALAPGESPTQPVVGVGIPGTVGTATWQVVAGALAQDLGIDVFSRALITATGGSAGTYSDSLAGTGATTVDIVPDPLTLVRVDPSGDGHVRTIQEGLYIAGDGDTVVVAPATYSGAMNRGLDFGGRGVSLLAEGGRSETVIDCGGEDRGFDFDGGEGASAIVDGFTVVNGAPDGFGGGIRFTNGSSPTVRNSAFIGNTCGFLGGGIYCDGGSSPTLEYLLVSDNSSLLGSGLYCKEGAAPTVSHCTFVGNSGHQVTSVDASPMITNSIIAFSPAGSAMTCGGTADPTVTLSCVYGNDGGDELCGGHYDNISADPLFCDLAGGVFTLHDDSPCLPENNVWFESIGVFGAGGCGTSTGVHGDETGSVASLRASPNPFRRRTDFEFAAPSATGSALVAVYNLKGQRVRTLLRGAVPEGRQTLSWDGTDDAGRRVASGVYFCTAAFGNEEVSHKVVLLR